MAKNSPTLKGWAFDFFGRESTKSSSSRSRLKEVARGIRELSSDVHKISYQLHPAKLDQLGLVVAARTFCAELARQCNIRIDFIHDEIPRELHPNLALCLYRVLQEALQNCVKHSGASSARVELKLRENEISLTVSDAGRGFDLANAKRQGGLGFISMRERVSQAGGELVLESSETGTRVEVRIQAAFMAAVAE